MLLQSIIFIYMFIISMSADQWSHMINVFSCRRLLTLYVFVSKLIEKKNRRKIQKPPIQAVAEPGGQGGRRAPWRPSKKYGAPSILFV